MDRNEKRICTEDCGSTKISKFHDGDSLLAIQHFISRYDGNSFQEDWNCGHPVVDFGEIVITYPEDEYGEDKFYTYDY